MKKFDEYLELSVENVFEKKLVDLVDPDEMQELIIGNFSEAKSPNKLY